MEKIDERAAAYISLEAVAHNFQAMRDNIRPETKIIAVVKADAYGHGAVPIARLVEGYDYIWGFAVATADEAIKLREAGIAKPVLILGIIFSQHFEELIAHDVRLALSDLFMAKELNGTAARMGKKALVHIALDTGMSRIGFPADASSVPLVKEIVSLPDVTVEGIFTHFSRADETDRTPGLEALERYLAFVRLLEEAGINIPMKHASNSAGIIRLPEANLSAVRAGITIYGLYPSDEVERDIVKLEPVMELKSHLTFVKKIPAGTAVSYGGTYVAKEERILGTVPVGYADGYPRLLSGKADVLIRGRRAPVCGRICMDQFMVDVTDIPGAAAGDEVTLLGRDGGEFISMEELGRLSGRFPYELPCCITQRVPRVYSGRGE